MGEKLPLARGVPSPGTGETPLAGGAAPVAGENAAGRSGGASLEGAAEAPARELAATSVGPDEKRV